MSEQGETQHGFITQTMINMMVNGSAMSPSKRRLIYLLVILSLLLVLWLPAIAIISLSKPTYTSKWTLILPGTGAGHAVSLDSIGQATATVSSPYAGTSLDPKVNYKAIAESEPVLLNAAEKLNLSIKEFGKPRIKLKDQSTLMYFQIKSDSPQCARDKAFALYEALQEQLEWLRDDEAQSREFAIRQMLSGFSDKLTEAQKNILDYQTQSSIVSIEQFNELALTIERMRSDKARLNAELSGLQMQLSSMSETLDIDPTLAVDALALHQDQVFQHHLKLYADSSSSLNEYHAKLGHKHPKLINLERQKKKAHRDLILRSQKLLRKNLPVDQLLTLGINDNRSGLYKDLVTLHAKVTGMQSQNEMMDVEMLAIQQRLDDNTDDAASLEDLKRKQQVATAVFTTALAKLDIGKSDAFSSYPLLQMLATPTLPEKPDVLRKILAIGGAAAGSLFILTAFGLLWIRKPYLRKILMKK